MTGVLVQGDTDTERREPRDQEMLEKCSYKPQSSRSQKVWERPSPTGFRGTTAGPSP